MVENREWFGKTKEEKVEINPKNITMGDLKRSKDHADGSHGIKKRGREKEEKNDSRNKRRPVHGKKRVTLLLEMVAPKKRKLGSGGPKGKGGIGGVGYVGGPHCVKKGKGFMDGKHHQDLFGGGDLGRRILEESLIVKWGDTVGGQRKWRTTRRK